MTIASSWLLPALLCLVAWGFARFFPKAATNHIDPKSAFVYEILGEVLVALVILSSIAFRPAFNAKGFSFALTAGVLGGLGVYFFLVAAQRGNVSQLVGLTALYPVITVLLGVFLLNEPLSLKQIVGVGLAVAAVILVAS